MTENLKWEKKEKLNVVNILDSINDSVKQYVGNEVKEIYSKIEMLNKMGLISNSEDFNLLKEKVAGLKL
jgi:hypothetical protein